MGMKNENGSVAVISCGIEIHIVLRNKVYQSTYFVVRQSGIFVLDLTLFIISFEVGTHIIEL